MLVEKKIHPPDDSSQLHSLVSTLLSERIAFNTSGNVFEPETDSKVHIHWKGVADIVLASCTEYLDSNGSFQNIDEDKELMSTTIDDMEASSLRCVAIAYRPYELDKVPTEEESLSQWALPDDNLVLLAIVGIKDPCRPGVKDAVRLCTEVGVKVRMVIEDNLQTAKAIALV